MLTPNDHFLSTSSLLHSSTLSQFRFEPSLHAYKNNLARWLLYLITSAPFPWIPRAVEMNLQARSNSKNTFPVSFAVSFKFETWKVNAFFHPFYFEFFLLCLRKRMSDAMRVAEKIRENIMPPWIAEQELGNVQETTLLHWRGKRWVLQKTPAS